ncbi:MAG TPA: RNA methyltransferase substrate-binding domain-containing protein, partial [Hyphomicrobium sp.]|nr:RNA methyltransferase substrate-binding domain-containing protein [Hyphomicrobium sp.]
MTNGWAGKKGPKKRDFGRHGPRGGPRGGSRDRAPAGGSAKTDDGLIRLFGSHAVEAALKNPRRRVIRLLATENAERRLADVIAAKGVPIDRA